MKIIDAHLHLFSEDSAEEMARQVGHHNNVDHLREVYGELHIAHGVVMGNHSLELRRHDYPTDLFHYCVGLDSAPAGGRSRVIPDLADRVEAHLRRDNCCGVKLYPRVQQDRSVGPHVPAHLPPGSPVTVSRWPFTWG